MVSFRLASTLLFAGVASSDATLRSRRLSFQSIAGYEPGSLVTDHNALDLDQAAMETQLALGTAESFSVAKALYTNGAHSRSLATVTLSSALSSPINADTPVTGKSVKGHDLKGIVYEDYSAGTSVIQIQYDVNTIQSTYVGCQVGANPDPITDGCLVASGDLVIDGQSFNYTYDVLTDNVNGRTLQGFSLQAEEKMYKCENCPYKTYNKFYKYYGAYDYADKWIMAAFDGKATSFANGNADFSMYSEVGRAEAIKKGSAYMSVWMYIIREFEDALDDCQKNCAANNCNDEPVNAWDEGVAFYTGSIEGSDGSGDGVFPYALADKRCQNFKTCGDLANQVSGGSHVNMQILAQFVDGKRKLLAGQCSEARQNKVRIEQLMAIPLVQGALRYAYVTDLGNDASEKAEAEGATFAAAVLPLVSACDEDAADTIYKNLKVGQKGSANFVAVKNAFESVYECMNIRCEDVGGLYDAATGGYLKYAEPCNTTTSNDKNVGLIVGLTFGGLALVGLVVFLSRRFCGSHSNINTSADVGGDKMVA